jgi:protein SCO1/2
MKKRKKEKMGISSKIAGFSIIILSVIGICWFLSVVYERRNNLPVLGEPGHVAGSFSFVNQDGNTVTEKLVQDKVTVVEYFFTSCPSLCPVMNRNLKAVYEEFKQNPDFMILSYTADPGRDSVPVLRAYAKRYDAVAPGWQFLTGDKNALYSIAGKDYLLTVSDSGSADFIHTQYVALLDKKRRVRGFYDASSKENVLKLSADIKRLLEDGSD